MISNISDELHSALEYINSAVSEISTLDNTIQELNQALSWVIFQYHMCKLHPQYTPSLPSIAPVCAVLFPEGISDKNSEAEIAYFDQFLSTIKTFSFTPESLDVQWAKSQQLLEYIEKMYNKYIA